MKKSLKIGVAVVVLAVGGYFAVTQLGLRSSDYLKDVSSTDIQKIGPPTIAVVNLSEVQDAIVMRDLQKQLMGYQKQLQANSDAMRKQFEQKQKDIEQQQRQKVLSDEALQARIATFQKEFTSAQQKLNDQSAALQAVSQKALEDLGQKYIDPIVAEIAKKKGVMIVLDGRTARVFQPELDITKDVIRGLDASVSHYSLKSPF